MKDELEAPFLDEWLRATEVTPPEPYQGARRVASQLPHTKQVGRWLPFPVFHRKAQAKTPTATNTTAYQPDPIPATNGHTPTVIGRTQTMFSPAKAITAGALVFAIGGVMLIAQPFERQGSVPGAETEAIAPTWVTGTVFPASSCSGEDVVEDGDVRRRRDVECSPQRWTSSDPRLTGQVVRRWNDDIYQTDEGDITVSMDAAYLRNDDGGWACSNESVLKGFGRITEDVTGGTFTHTCVGDGGYAGLSAILVLEAAAGFSEEFVGLIFSGDLPPLPEPPAAE